MNRKNQTVNLVMTGLCIAIGIVLPMAFHSVPNAGSVILPMHIPVLLCGLICGPIYGLAAGILTPALSSLLTQMPPMAYLPSMLCELALYGLVAGLAIRLIQTKSNAANVYLSLVAAMLCGRVIYGIVNALIFQAGKYSMELWVTASFVTALPGIIIQLVAIPVLVLLLQKAGLIRNVQCA